MKFLEGTAPQCLVDKRNERESLGIILIAFVEVEPRKGSNSE